MVSALIIQSLFSRRVFWEFPLMEGQIDSYEIVITAFLSDECTHQIAEEDMLNLRWGGWGGGREGGGSESSPIRQCQIPQQACLSFVSTMLLLPVFYLLPVSPVTDGAFWAARAPCQRFSCQGCLFVGTGSLRPSTSRGRWLLESANLIEMLSAAEWFNLHIPDIMRQGEQLETDFCWLIKGKRKQTAESGNDIAVWQRFQKRVCYLHSNTTRLCIRQFNPLRSTNIHCKRNSEDNQEIIQTGNWRHIQDREHVSKYIWQSSLCCWNRSGGYSLPCQEELMHKQHCHIYIGIPAESFHCCAVILTTSAVGTWQYRHNTCS